MMYHPITLHGLIRDIDPIEINGGAGTAYTELENMTPEPGMMRRALGYRWQWSIDETPGSEVGALAAPYYLSYSPQLSVNYWVYAGASLVAIIDEAWAHTEITPAGGLSATNTDGWTGGNLNGIAVLNNPENDAIYWNSGQPLALVLPGLRAGTRYNIMRPHKYHLIGLGVLDGTGTFEDAVHWSDAADPGQVPQTWLPTDDNEAGDNVLADETGKIIDGLSLRDSFFIYKQDCVYEMSYIGGNEVFRFSKVFSSTGALAKNCVARVEGTHIVLGAGDIYQHDGQNMKSLADGRVKEAVFAAIDNVYFYNSFVAYLESEKKVWICFPTAGNEWPNVAVIYDPQTDSFGWRDIDPTSHMAAGVLGPKSQVAGGEAWEDDDEAWEDDTTAWLQETIQQRDDSLAMADPVSDRFYVANTGVLADGKEYGSKVVVAGLDLGDASSLKAVRRIYPRINAQTGQRFKMRVFGQDSASDNPLYAPDIEFTPSREGIAVDINCRYLGIELESLDSVAWNVSGFDVHHGRRGLF